ncbi:hypothetical protein RYQ61_00425 [Streptococcus intermedius]|uniref:hypothetical protein n=1 Tax=Streptococcus intermedius TaxID=1338 RepID=UPI00294376E1|nr:hypothetical protein [Streptococcus intermedius]WOI91363.1 hypothetical protein RYQ61_00425 [Streptococcus intermedius]
MKKLLFTTSIMLLSATILIACSNGRTDNASSGDTSEKVTQSSSKSVKKKTATNIDDFKQKLKTNGFTIEREQEKSASLVQAKEGKGFVLSDGSSVEVYQYDSDNDYFKKIQKERTLLGQPVNIYGNFVVMIVNPTDSKNKILDSFKEFE